MDEFLESASPSVCVKGGEAHIPAVIFTSTGFFGDLEHAVAVGGE